MVDTKPLRESDAFPLAATEWAQAKGLLDVGGNSDFVKLSTNLNDIPNKPQARFNLGLEIGSQVQAYSPRLSAYAAGADPVEFSLNLLSLTSSAQWRTALSVGEGTVTSVTLSGGTTGLTTSGGPITGSGTITLGGTLAVANGGTGVTTLDELKTALSLQNVNNTGDMAKPISIAMQSALDAKVSTLGTPDTTFSPNIFTANIAGTGGPTSGNAGAGINFRGLSSGSTYSDLAFISGIKENNTDGNYAGALVFGTRVHGTGSGSLEKMRISSDGTISMGTKNAKTRLNVAGHSGGGAPSPGITSGSMFVSNNDNGYGLLVGVDSPSGAPWLQAQRTDGTAATYNLWLQPSGGNVGIGSIAPGHKLTVAGSVTDLQSITSTTNASGLLMGDSAGTVRVGSRSGAFIIDVIAERFRIATNGNVGIGTNNPGSTLDVRGDTVVTNGTNGVRVSAIEGALELFRSDSAAYIDFKTDANEDSDCRIQQRDNGLAFNTGGNTSVSERLFISNTGNVGIGEPSPGNKLTVKGSVGSVALFAATTGAFQGISLKNNESTATVESVSFIDNLNSSGIADSHLFFRHRVDGSSQFELGLTPVGSKTVDRRLPKFSIDPSGVYSGGDNSMVLGWSGNRWKETHTYQHFNYDNLFLVGANTSAWKRLIQFRDGGGTSKWEMGVDINNNGGRNFYIWDTVGGYASLIIDQPNATFNTHIIPATDNTKNIGSGALRFGTIFSATGAINTSDYRLKQDIDSLPEGVELDDLLDAWGDVKWTSYRFKDAYLDKGEDARFHFGLIAQHVKDAIDDRLGEGMAVRFGLLCYNEWDDQTTTDAEGETIINTAAGNRWGLRYDECQALQEMYNHRRMSRIEAAIAALQAAQ